MNYAIIPWASQFMKDKMFDVNDPSINFDHRQDPYLDMKLAFEKKGDMLHTIDMYDNLSEIDYFLFFELDWKWILKIAGIGKTERTVYCNAEPPSVNKLNSPKGYQRLKYFFPYIMSWNDDWIDGKNIFKRNIPYYFNKLCSSSLSFSERKLLTSISGYKKSSHPNELYSERERLINFFEENYPNDFSFYGTGWDSSTHPCYLGRSEIKSQTFQMYRFALCFENIGGLKGYVSEKILDCLTSGIVPIYLGATNINNYIPNECFIDYRDFSSPHELAEYLFSVSEKEYSTFMENTKKFLTSDSLKLFSGEEYANCIKKAISYKKSFHIARKHFPLLVFYVLIQEKNKKIIQFKKKLKGYLK